jgi:hypothetical protein
MRPFLASTLAAVALGLCVSPDASADWRYRTPTRFNHGWRVGYRERCWVPPVVVTPPAACPVQPAGYFGGWWGHSYRHYHGSHYPHYRNLHHRYYHRR